jgi:UDP-N-acetylmuramate: L-alanyl-gamma-D-glutamyl-meso-diaminopimelate ligase
MNNLEFDHADIFDDLEAIQRQFHHLVRTVPGNGLIVSPLNDSALHDVLDMGCWTPVEHFDPDLEASWHVANAAADGSAFDVVCDARDVGRVSWPLTGRHNVSNALAALAAARHAGVPPAVGIEALAAFRNVRRRMELRGEVRGVRVYDDFAHHPTAIATTLDGLRRHVGDRRILAVLEPRSNTMRMGVHAGLLAGSLSQADQVWVYAPPGLGWDAASVLRQLGGRLHVCDNTEAIVGQVAAEASTGDQVLVMSNGGFEGIHQRLLDALAEV